MQKRIAVPLLAVVALVAVAQVGLRFGLSHDVDRLQVDPLEVTKPTTNNFGLIRPPESPTFSVAPPELEEAVMAVMASFARTDQLASTEDPPLSTWVTTSLIWAFPDYTSIRVVELDEGMSTLAMYSRSRFGQYDGGVNANRNAAILALVVEELEKE